MRSAPGVTCSNDATALVFFRSGNIGVNTKSLGARFVVMVREGALPLSGTPSLPFKILLILIINLPSGSPEIVENHMATGAPHIRLWTILDDQEQNIESLAPSSYPGIFPSPPNY